MLGMVQSWNLLVLGEQLPCQIETICFSNRQGSHGSMPLMDYSQFARESSLWDFDWGQFCGNYIDGKLGESGIASFQSLLGALGTG